MSRLALALLLGAACWPAFAQEPVQMREGMPAVLDGAATRARQRAEADARALADFGAAYQRAQRPAFLIMWHRELSDNIDSGKEVSATAVGSGELARDNYARTIKLQWKQGAEHPVSLLAPARAAEFESGFQQTLARAGVALVDRNTAVRMTALKRVEGGASESALNFQTVEASALARFARYFIELRFVPDANAAGGSVARVTVIESQSGVILADLLASEVLLDAAGKPAPPAGGEWVAVDGKGFERRERPHSQQEDGRQLAQALMRALAARLP